MYYTTVQPVKESDKDLSFETKPIESDVNALTIFYSLREKYGTNHNLNFMGLKNEILTVHRAK